MARPTLFDLRDHQIGEPFLGFGAVDSTAVAHAVEHHRLALRDLAACAGHEHIQRHGKVDVVRYRRPNKSGMLRQRRDWIVERTFGFAESERSSHGSGVGVRWLG